jgi:hypothetical protein
LPFVGDSGPGVVMAYVAIGILMSVTRGQALRARRPPGELVRAG